MPDPDLLVKEFWNIVNNVNKVSVNILSGSDVSVESVDEKSIVVINVPRAQRADRPVYLLDNPLRESYRRNGGGETTVAPRRKSAPCSAMPPCAHRT